MSGNDTIPPTPTELDSTVCFPPREHADFVVHCADTAFHVHKLVLHHHSAYFRAYFQTAASSSSSPATNHTLPSDTQPGSSPSDAVPSARSTTSSKRARLDTPPSSPDSVLHSAKKAKTTQSSGSSASSAPSQPCDHPSIAHCIHLPQQCTLVGEQAVTAADFELFLRHLYFSAHYCYPPFLPKTDIDLAAHCPPLSLIFPAVASFDWGSECPLRCHKNGGGRTEYWEELLALAHYFDCAAMTAQCEAVLLSQMDSLRSIRDEHWLDGECAQFLLDADRYHLQTVKKAYIGVIAAAGKALLQSDEYKAAKQKWSKELVVEIMEAAVGGTE